mgnify:CR=1 FL=1
MKKTRFNYLIPCIFILISYALYSQQDQNEYTVKFTSKEIKIDGNDNDIAWSEAESTITQWTYFPTISNKFESPTLIKMLYDYGSHHLQGHGDLNNNLLKQVLIHL